MKFNFYKMRTVFNLLKTLFSIAYPYPAYRHAGAEEIQREFSRIEIACSNTSLVPAQPAVGGRGSLPINITGV
jgi:hypothetical protein